MIRLYEYMVERIVLSLCWMRDNKVRYDPTIRDHALRTARYGPDRTLRSIADHHLNNMTLVPADMPLEIDELVTTLRDLLAKEERGDGDLIDKVVEVLGLPYTGNVINGRMLTNLRQALLLPSEAAAAALVRVQEMNCINCTHPFQEGEMATLHMERGSVGFLCTNCMHPMYMTCPECRGSAALSEKVQKWLFKKGSVVCGTCQMPQKEAVQPAQPANPGGMIDVGDRAEVIPNRIRERLQNAARDLRQGTNQLWTGDDNQTLAQPRVGQGQAAPPQPRQGFAEFMDERRRGLGADADAMDVGAVQTWAREIATREPLMFTPDQPLTDAELDQTVRREVEQIQREREREETQAAGIGEAAGRAHPIVGETL